MMISSATHKYRAAIIFVLAIFILFIYKNCSITYAGIPAGVSYSSANCVKLSLDTTQSVECQGFGRWCSFTAPNDGYYKFYGIMTSNNGQYNYVWLNGRLYNDPKENSLNTVGSSDSSNHSFVEYLQMSKSQTVYLLLECRHGSQTFADVTVCTAPRPVDTPPDYNPEYDNPDSTTQKTATQKGKNAVKKSARKKGKKITIKLKPNKGKLKKRTKKVYKNGTYGKLPKPTRKGYKFKGWYTKKSKGKKVTSKTKVSKRVLYAHWKKLSKKSKKKNNKKVEIKLSTPRNIVITKERTEWTNEKRYTNFYLSWSAVQNADGYGVEFDHTQYHHNISTITYKDITESSIYIGSDYASYYSINGNPKAWHRMSFDHYKIRVRAYKNKNTYEKIYSDFSSQIDCNCIDPDILK